MCGRFTLRTKLNLLLQQFAIEGRGLDALPRYNIAPTTLRVRSFGRMVQAGTCNGQVGLDSVVVKRAESVLIHNQRAGLKRRQRSRHFVRR